MFSWKEKVSGKFSRILEESASSQSDQSRESTVVRPEHQDIPSSREELSSRGTTYSSYLLSILPTTLANIDTQKLTNIKHGFRQVPLPSLPSLSSLPSLPSLPTRWKSKNFMWADKPLDQNTDDELEHTCVEATGTPEKILENVSGGNVREPLRIEETSPSHGFRNFPSVVEDESSFISTHLFEFLESSLPNLVKGCQWVLLYSTLKHGISLRTLLRKSSDLPGPCILIVGDMQGAVFGGLLDAPIKPTAKRKYQGTCQTFVFTTKYGDPRLFRPTGANRYYYLCLDELLAFGGGGNFALCLDEDLLHGTSGPCDTFGNLCLAHSPEFELKNVELWGFAHSSGSSLSLTG